MIETDNVIIGDENFELDMALCIPHDYQVHESGYAFDVQGGTIMGLPYIIDNSMPDDSFQLLNMTTTQMKDQAVRSSKVLNPIFGGLLGNLPGGVWDESESIGMPGKSRDPIR